MMQNYPLIKNWRITRQFFFLETVRIKTTLTRKKILNGFKKTGQG